MVADESNPLEVLAAYGASTDVLAEYSCQPLRARVVRGVVKLRTSAGTRALRKVYMSDERLQDVFECTEHVAAGGLYRVPRFIRTIYDDAYVAHPTGLYYMTAWIPGREVNLRHPDELAEAARLLAQWHLTAAGFSPSGDWSEAQSSYEQRVRALAEELQQCRRQAENTNAGERTMFDKLFLASADELFERVQVALEERTSGDEQALQEEADERGWVCHGNFGQSSVRYDGDAWSVVDYEHVHPAHPVYDVALFLQRAMPIHRWRSDVMLRTVAAYSSEFGAQHVHAAQLASLLAVPIRSLQIVAWYYRHAKPWDEEDYVDALESALDLEEAREEARAALILQSGAVSRGHSPGGTLRRPSEIAAETAALQHGTGPGTGMPVAELAFATVTAPGADVGAPDQSSGQDPVRNEAEQDKSEAGEPVYVEGLDEDAAQVEQPLEVASASDGTLTIRPPRKVKRQTRKKAPGTSHRQTKPPAVQPGLKLWGSVQPPEAD